MSRMENGQKCEHVGKKKYLIKIILEYILIQTDVHKLCIHLGDKWTGPNIDLDSATFPLWALKPFEP